MIKHVDEKAAKSDNNQDANMDLSGGSKSRYRHGTMQSSQTTTLQQSPSQINQTFSTSEPFQNSSFDTTNVYKAHPSFKNDIYRNDGLKTEFYNKDLAQTSMIYNRDLAQSENFSSELIRFTQGKYPK